MHTIDLHQDLLAHVRFKERFGQSDQTGFEVIALSDIDLVVATAFPLPPEDNQLHESVPTLITEELTLYREYVASHKDWQIVEDAGELMSNKKKLLLHIEGLNVFDGSKTAWEQLSKWVNSGVRSIGTHWNIQNALGGGTLQPEIPLTALGAEVISFLENNKIVFDMAHMGRQSFWDAAALTSRPLYVSHGNANSVCTSVRNYTDDQLKAIAETDGVIGVFFSSTFVAGKDRQGTIPDVIAHVDHIRKLIGIRHIAIGSDFGGIISRGIVDLEHVADLPHLFAALRECGYDEKDIAAISCNNARRVLHAHLT